jgi:hypothetical protein
LYRDLKLRGAIIKEKELLILPEEKLYNKIAGYAACHALQ